MEKQKYIINIGEYNGNENRCLSASFGGQGIPSDTIPWGDGNPTDYMWDGEKFVHDPLPIAEEEACPTQLDIVEAQILWTALQTNTLIRTE